MSLSNGPLWSGVVTLLAIVLYQYMGARVGVLRSKLGIRAPATTGDPMFERASRVHLNTGEQYIAFLPLLWLATMFFHPMPWLPAAFGTAFLAARVIYLRLYMKAPETRLPGAFMTLLSIIGLIALSAIGLVQAAMA